MASKLLMLAAAILATGAWAFGAPGAALVPGRPWSGALRAHDGEESPPINIECTERPSSRRRSFLSSLLVASSVSFPLVASAAKGAAEYDLECEYRNANDLRSCDVHMYRSTVSCNPTRIQITCVTCCK